MKIKVIVWVCALALSSGLLAQPQTPEELEQEQPGVSREQAEQIALRHVPGEVVDVEVDTWNEEPVWEVTVESEDGWDYVVFINPDNGRIVEVDG